MLKYRRKPEVVDAEQFWPNEKPWPEGVKADVVNPKFARPFVTVFGQPIPVHSGDWVLTNAKGERCVRESDVFQATYELVQGEGE